MLARTCCLLLMFVVVRAVALDCGEVRTVTQLNVTQLNGKWMVLEYVLFSDGVPTSEGPKDSCAPPQPQCVTAKVKANHTNLAVKSKMLISEDEMRTVRSMYNVSEVGRWTLNTNVPSRIDTEVLVLAADPAKYFVDLTCVPGSSSFPARVNFYVRRAPDDSEELPEARGYRRRPNYVSMTQDELQSVRATVAQALGVDKLDTIKHDVECYKKKKKGGYRGHQRH